jgi:hypothetical protein
VPLKAIVAADPASIDKAALLPLLKTPVFGYHVPV